MSEGSKMGLFGSKDDKTESTSTETSKPGSPDGYAPYCIDSDSETYDTEALSMMDINDIIGVQSGQAVESTLESEIAALTEIITDSKCETQSDSMNPMHGESSDDKFNEDLLKEFASLSPSENTIPTTSEHGFDEGLITDEIEAKIVDGIPSGASISENITFVVHKTDNSESKDMPETKTEIAPDSGATEAKDVAFSSLEESNELDGRKEESKSVDGVKEEATLSPAVRSCNEITQNDEVLATEENKVPVKTDTDSEMETVGKSISQNAADSLEETAKTVETNLDDKRKGDGKSVQDAVQDLDSVTQLESTNKEEVNDPQDEKLEDFFTNMGSTSKSLQLIGEAYISDDSQETDEQDDSPVASVALPKIEGKEIVGEDNEPQEKGSSDNVSSDTPINESKINTGAKNLESSVEKCYLDNRDSISSEDNKKPDNVKEVLPNLQDNHEENRSQDLSVDSQGNVRRKDDMVMEEDKSVDSSSLNDENIDGSNESVQVTSLPSVSGDPDISSTLETTELLETEEISLQKTKREEIKSTPEDETVEMTTEDEVCKMETNPDAEKDQEKTLKEGELPHQAMEISETGAETLNSNTGTALKAANSSTEDLESSEKSQVLPSSVLACLNTESENTIEIVSEIQTQRIEVTKSVEPEAESIDEQDNAVSVESNIEKKLIDSQSDEVSLSSLQHSIIEYKSSPKDSQSPVLSVEVDTHLGDEDKRFASTTESLEEIIPIEEESTETSDNVEQILDAVQENVEDNTVIEEDIPLLQKVEDNTETEDEDSSIQKIVPSIEEEEEKLDSKSSELPMDDKSQLVEMEITPPIVEETGEDSISSDIMPTNEQNLAIEETEEQMDEAKNLGTQLDQSTSRNCTENNSPVGDVMEINEQEKTETSYEIETLASDIAGADSSSSTRDASENEILNSITTEDIPESTIETTLENITSATVESKSLGVVEPDSSKDELNKAETIERLDETLEIAEAEIADSETRVESQILATDEEEVSKIEACDEIQQLEEKESVSELSLDTENKQIKDTSNEDVTEIEESPTITETSTEKVCDEITTAAELETASEVSTAQDPLECDSQSQSEPQEEEDENELKIQPMRNKVDDSDVLENQQESDDKSESTIKNDGSSGDARPDTGSEILSDKRADEKQDSPEIQEEISEDNAILDEFSSSVRPDKLIENSSKAISEVSEDLPGNQVSETPGLRIEAEELGEMQSDSLVSNDAPKLFEEEEELQEEKLLPIKSIDDKILDDVSDLQSLGETLELIQTSSGENEVDDSSEGPALNLESEVKTDEDLQFEPIEDLEKLAVVADEILIDELANSVLKDTPQSLENIINLEILPDSLVSSPIIVSPDELQSIAVTNESSEIKDESVSLLSEVNETCFIEDLNQTPSVSHGANYITDVIMSSTNIDNIQLTDNIKDMDDENVTADEFDQKNQGEEAKTSEDIISKDTISIDRSIKTISEACQLEIEGNVDLDKNSEIDLQLKQEEEKLIESAVLQACDTKIDLPDELLLDAENAEQTDILCGAPVDNVDTSQQSSEFSELECAVKFLQESEEQTIDSPLLLSPKIAEEIVEDNSDQSKSCLFLSETEVCQDTLELPVELEEITPDSIAISEAEIISEAAKLENERKLKIAATISKTPVNVEELGMNEKSVSESNSEMLKSLLTTSEAPSWQEKLGKNIPSTSEKSEDTQIPELTENIIRRSEKIPKISILEERLKEPPQIEIPVPEISPRISDTPTTPRTSLLIQRDSRIDTRTMYQKMLESPKAGDKNEPKIMDTPRKDSEKYDFENVGSPRIILKIAKSAIADCGEPRSPKSPKIRSAANSPNPEDSPGQKLGKIKLKLSKGGHPSIISNENFDETAQRHTEAILSPSHIGMKIKLSKTGDASIIQPEKHDLIDDIKESKHKFGESSPRRIESPLGMKIKLSKTGDPSIVQQESKDLTPKRKDKSDIGQEIPKRTDSPIGMKIKLSKSGDASIIQPEKQETSEDLVCKDKFEITTEIPRRTESPLGMKIKLSKTGDASIISSECCEEFKDSSSKSREKLSTNQDIPKRTDSPLGMKFKLSKSGGASIIQPERCEAFDDFKDRSETSADIMKRVESPIGMKIKLLKTGDASIIHPEKQDPDEHRESIMMKHREKSETLEIQKRTDSPLGMRIKVTKSREASVVLSEEFKESTSSSTENFDITHEVPKRNESPIGMKIKLSKSGDASIIHPEKQELYDEYRDSIASIRGISSTSQEGSKSSESSSLGMKIKLSKTGDASIIHTEISPESKDSQSKRAEKLHSPGEGSKRTDSPLGMKIKLSKTGDASIIEPDKKEKTTTKQREKLTNVPETSQKRKEMEYPLEMKIKLSKTGHPTIIANEKQESFAEIHLKSKDHPESGQSGYKRHTESMAPAKDSQLRIFKTGHSTIIQSSRSEVTIEPIQIHTEQSESSLNISPKDNSVMISPVDLKKSKLEAKLSHILPEVTIQPVASGEQKQIMLDKKSSTISRQQMSVINQEISITHVQHPKPPDLSMSGKLKEILRKNASNSPANSDCEIIEHRPELIIVNENSNSSQDVMIIEEVKVPLQEVKIPRKRGRPKRSSLPPGQPLMRPIIQPDPLALDIAQSSNMIENKETDRPKRTCRNQKSYAPPKRGRGRGRGKRKMDRADCAMGKIPRLEDPLTEIERSTMSLIAPLQPRMLPESTTETSELYKALKLSPAERKRLISENLAKHGFPDPQKKIRLESESGKQLPTDLPTVSRTEDKPLPALDVDTSDPKTIMISEILQIAESITAEESTEKMLEAPKPEIQEAKNIITDITTTEHQNWLTPSIKLPETTGKTEAISIVQVDEETRMSADSNSRSQTPARNISMPAAETVINEESQGSVLSTATTESEKVKVRNRRMEINFDPDEGPFTVDKIAEYEWPLDKKGDTFMLQEQISQYLGVKSFKRKYPDLKRRMVEMEERNFLRENCLVSEAMCDMGLTAICSTEVLDIMCSDFPDQYEEYRKHMREKQAKEHSKKQKELTAAANAERNRIDLAEMAVQSALSWNVNFNKARKESRKYSLDLQSFTIHVPKKQLKVDAERKASNYPVALIPGQYTDYYREYTPAELRYYPLNTVLYGPMRPNERKFDSQSEGSQSDSDSDSSSDDSSSSSSEGTQDTEESQSTVDDVDMDIAAHKEDNKNLKCKMCLKHLNKHGKAEVLIQCGTCNGNVHPSCIDLTLDMVPHIQGYSWQCTDCKTCVQCHNPADEDKMLFCDMCDRGYHIYCVGLRRVPQGRWHCRECAVCASCGLRQPGGANSDRNSVAQWQHEYKKGERNTRVYVSTLCVPCSKLWRKGRYCPHCSRCHSAQRLDLEPNLVHCGACDKYLHLGCVEIRSGPLDRKNYICDWCSTPGQQFSRTLISKNFKT